jgi:hypothetical protein
MKKFLAGVLSAALLLGVAGLAYSQTYALPQVTNGYVGPTDLFQDLVNGVASGPSNVYATAAMISGPQGYVKTTPLTGFSLSFAPGQIWMLLTPAGTLSTGTITMTANPGQGQRDCFRSTQTITTLTMAVASGSGQTIDSPITTDTSATTTYCWVYNQASSTWDPI